MDVHILRRILVRDLAAVGRAVAAYPRESDLWVRPGGVPNSAGTLALHLAGNLSHYIGAILGGGGYVRDREGEFGDTDVPRDEILRRLDAASRAVDSTLAELDPARLAEPFPVPVGGATLPTGAFLLHLATHLAYHQGQLDYHRRMVTGQGSGVESQSVTALADALGS